MNTYEMLCDEYAHEWGLSMSAHPAPVPAPAPVVAQPTDDGIDYRAGLNDVRAKLDEAAERWMFFRHLFAGKTLMQKLDVLINLAVEGEENPRLRALVRTYGLERDAALAGGAL